MNIVVKWLKEIVSQSLDKPFEKKIDSKILTVPISKIIENVLKKKLGYDIDIQLNSLVLSSTENGRLHARLDIDAETDTKVVKGWINGEEKG